MSPKRLFLMVLASCFVCVGAGDALADATITGSVKLDLPGGKKPRRKKLQTEKVPGPKGPSPSGRPQDVGQASPGRRAPNIEVF